MEIPASVLAVGRAGAGTNNIPVAALSQRGVPVFNCPGANANAVKELVLAGLFLGARHISAPRSSSCVPSTLQAMRSRPRWSRARSASSATSLPGRTLGVVGLGAIGVEVANAAHLLGMHVLGYDPQITVQRAWQLSSGVEQALSLEDLFARSHAVTVHVPLRGCDARTGQRKAHCLDAERQHGAQFRAGGDRRRSGGSRRARCRQAGRLCLRLPEAQSKTSRASSRCRTSAHRPAKRRRTAR